MPGSESFPDNFHRCKKNGTILLFPLHKTEIMQSNQSTATANNLTEETWTMRDMIQKFGLTQAEILEAVKEVGTNKARLEAYLSERQ
ncbi:DUF3606 domain-containing protein [Filimonas effusa]|uniref:DUF3606 domain-containing protein n=2 Tax=Filimonas effusa TaxID=2508721 RepID=A0A4V1MA29_9BACT|nr:DUF3606 domain-containing protein [Filimonas effusa]